MAVVAHLPYLKALKEMIKLLWREVPRQLGQQLMNVFHNRLVFPGLRDTANLSAALTSASALRILAACYRLPLITSYPR